LGGIMPKLSKTASMVLLSVKIGDLRML